MTVTQLGLLYRCKSHYILYISCCASMCNYNSLSISAECYFLTVKWSKSIYHTHKYLYVEILETAVANGSSYIWQVTLDLWNTTPDMWHVAPEKWQLIKKKKNDILVSVLLFAHIKIFTVSRICFIYSYRVTSKCP